MAALICEVVYRGIFQKNLAARIARGIVLSARKSGRWGIAFGRYGDSPQRNGIPAKDFAIVADSKEELEQNMARYEPKHVDVTICVDDTLSKGVESWAWYGLQPINRLTVPNGTVLMTSLQSLRRSCCSDIHKKDAPYKLSLIRAKASLLRAVGLQGGPHRGAHPRRAGQDRAVVPDPGRGVPGHPGDRSGAPTSRSPRPARPTTGWRRARSRSPRATPRSRTRSRCRSGGRCARASRSRPSPSASRRRAGRATCPSATRTSRSTRPARCARSIDFDTCVKCNLCWISCPDSCFDVMPDATFDANMEACCGCGVCEAVCPVENCITMVNESAF